MIAPAGASAPYPKGRRVISLDVETTGLDCFHGAEIFCWGFFTDKNEYGFMRANKANFKWVERLFNDPHKKIVFHNGKFDLKMFWSHGIDIFNAKAEIHCTLTMDKVLNSTSWSGHDLATLGKKYLGRRTDDKFEIKDWLKERNSKKQVRERGRKLGFGDAPEELVRKRVLWDVETTIGLYYYLKPQIENTCPELYETERDLLFVTVDMETYGHEVDITKTKQLKAEAIEHLKGMLEEIRSFAPDGIKVNKVSKGQKIQVEVLGRQINPGSNQHLEGLFNHVGIQLKYKTKGKKDKRTGQIRSGGNWAFDEYAMVRYVSRPLAETMRESSEEGWTPRRFNKSIHVTVKKNKLEPRELIPPLVLRYKQLSKMVSTYYDAILKFAVDVHKRPDGREVGTLHCLFNPAEAKTGRFSSSKPNLQNIPRILGPRECFIPRKARRHWHLDYSQVEMRFFCHFAKDRGMAAAIDSDIHEYVATKIYKKPRDQVTKEQRKRAKGTGFGILYGSGAETQAETLTKKGLPTTEAQAKQTIVAYHHEFPSVKRVTKNFKLELVRKGYIENPFGRRYRIPSKFGYKGLNYMCQGSSADLIKRAMVKVWKWLRKMGHKTRLLLTVHDELVFESPRSEERRVIPRIMKMMEDHTSFFLPIKVDAEVVKHRWSQKYDAVKDLGLKWAA